MVHFGGIKKWSTAVEGDPKASFSLAKSGRKRLRDTCIDILYITTDFIIRISELDAKKGGSGGHILIIT